MQSIACYYIRGDELEANHDLAFELSIKAAEQGNGLAMRTVGTCYQYGYGVEEDMKLAIEWYEISLELVYDPDFEQKVAVFKMMNDENFFDDVDGFIDDDE